MAADRHREAHGSGSFRNKYHRSSRHGSEDEYKESKRNSGSSRLRQPEIKTEYDVHKQGEEMSDGEFDFSKHKYTLNKIFFRDQDVIQRGSVEYDDFWTFLKRYKDFEKKKCSTTGTKNGGAADNNVKRSYVADTSKEVRNDGAENDLGIPVNYDKRYKINFSIMSGDIEELVRRIPIDTDDKDHLPRHRIAEFRYILLLYLDFRQKERFLKMQKLRHAQANLPIAQYKTTIIKALQNNQVIVVAGDTGCGKSTQVPQYLLEAGFGQIACTQPRRIACISLSKRVAFETLNEYGSQVGYQIRFDRSKTQHTKILFLTEGLLLRQVTTDPSLSGYNVIVLDEVHERHLHGDFLLGVIKCLLHQRKDLKVVMMSATINIDLFKNYFWNAPVIQVPGRLYPININYRPVSVVEKSSKTSRVNPAPYVRILQMIDDKYPQNERGDVLIFLSGMTEISTVVEAATTYNLQTQRWIILPLHSTLSIAEQDKVFDIAPDGVRKCIISTNIAETSITIDGIRFVIDSGKVKEMDFDPSCKMQRLREFWISRASAEQRKGRAGRTGPGVCFRLYSEAEFSAMSEYSTPEIQRVSLDTLVLQMIAMGLPDARKFPFIEPPPAESIENAVQSLKDHDAVTYDEKLTPVGQMLSNLPVDISIGKILIMGTLFHKVDPILSLASAMSVQSPFTNKSYRDTEAVAARKPLESDHGDPFTLLNVYNEWLTIKASQQAQSKKWCKRRGLEEQRFYEMTKLRRQFKDLLKDSGLLESMNKQGMGGLSSSERSQRHGDVKRLRELKRSFHRAPKRRKVLKLNVDGGESGSDEGEDVDIKDVEFQLQNNRTQVEELSLASRDFTLRDLQILKIILCSGIYPQVAIADEHNSYKPGTDQLFHTKNKPFVILHPNGVFSSIPEVLELHDCDRVDVPGFKSKHILSSRHQLLAYVSLMETTKPYLVNTMRVTSLHTVLLFAQEIDTNYDFSTIVFDRWLQVRLPEAACGQDLIMQTAEIRDTWHKMLSLVVKKENQASAADDDAAAPTSQSQDVVEMRHALTNMLIGFLQEEVVHSISRLLAADQKTLYLGPDVNEEMEAVSIMNDFEAFPHPKKGGIQLTDYLTYNCLQEDNFFSEAKTKNDFICPYCDSSIVVSVLEKMQHHWQCKRKHERHHIDKTSMPDRIDDKNPLKSEYFCPICDKNFRFTKTEILRHIRSHKPRD